MIHIFNEVLIRPLFNLLIYFYNSIPLHDLGLSIILLTAFIRLIVSPTSIKSQRAQRALQALNPQMQALKEKHKNDQAAQGAAIMQLYKDNNINPLSGCLPMLLQLPIMLALYQVMLTAFKPESLNMLYSFVANPGSLNPISFGIVDITMRNSFLAIITGVLQFLYGWYMIKNQGPNSSTASMNLPMLYLFPLLVVYITWRFPAGLAFYWIAVTLFSIAEQFYVARRLTHDRT
jgi:YidC/Oxa1 family membrane protein insertase